MPLRLIRRLLLVVALIAVGAGIAYFIHGRFFKGPPAAPPAPPPPAVTVQEITPQDIPLTFEYAGRTAGSREVEIRARIDGILTRRLYVEGQPVNQGDKLFEINPESYAASRAQANAVFNQAQADWTRAQGLFKEKALSARERDAARSNFEQARAAIQTADINLGYTTIIAPISGITSQEGLSEGSLVNANTSLLTRISQVDPIYVNFSAPDAEILSQRRLVTEGQLVLPEDGKLKAEIHFGDGSAYDKEGEIDFTDSLIDAETGTVRARAVVPNPDHVIMPGQFVRLIIKGFVKPNAVAIPDQSVLQGPQGPFVYVVNAQSKTTIRPVTLGMLNNTTRIIDKGLAEGDKVIVEGMIKTRPDAPVTITSADKPQAKNDAAAPAGKE